jgi:hypothetical protein
MGIVEPVTMAMYFFLGAAGAQATAWVEEAVAGESFPLLARVDIALRQFLESADRPKASWARMMIDDIVKPAFERFPPLH